MRKCTSVIYTAHGDAVEDDYFVINEKGAVHRFPGSEPELSLCLSVEVNDARSNVRQRLTTFCVDLFHAKAPFFRCDEQRALAFQQPSRAPSSLFDDFQFVV